MISIIQSKFSGVWLKQTLGITMHRVLHVALTRCIPVATVAALSETMTGIHIKKFRVGPTERV